MLLNKYNWEYIRRQIQNWYTWEQYVSILYQPNQTKYTGDIDISNMSVAIMFMPIAMFGTNL